MLHINNSNRDFQIKTVNFEGRIIVGIHLEHEPRFHHHRPKTWLSQTKKIINSADIVFVEYLPNELNDTIFNIPVIGFFIKLYSVRFTGINTVFRKISTFTKKANKPIACADIANTPLFTLFELGILTLVAIIHPFGTIYSATYLLQYILGAGIFGPKPNLIDSFVFSMTDARRHLTAQALRKAAKTLKPGDKIIYIAAPAHTSRVLKYLSAKQSLVVKIKLVLYQHIRLLNQPTRIYTSNNHNQWVKVPVSS